MDNNQKKFDPNKVPKYLCERIEIWHGPEYFAVGNFYGSNLALFAISPGGAKRLKQILEYHIGQFEKLYGKIQGPDWEPGVRSPLQMTDLQFPPDSPQGQNKNPPPR